MQAGGAGHTRCGARLPEGREKGTPGKAPRTPALPPGPERQALGSRRLTVSRELHAPSSAPYTAQAGVIDAGRGLARANANGSRRPRCRRGPGRPVVAASGRRRHPSPHPTQSRSLQLAPSAANKASGPLQCTDCGLRHRFNVLRGKGTGRGFKASPGGGKTSSDTRFCTLVPPQSRPYPSWKLLEGQGDTAPEGNAHELRAPCLHAVH